MLVVFDAADSAAAVTAATAPLSDALWVSPMPLLLHCKIEIVWDLDNPTQSDPQHKQHTNLKRHCCFLNGMAFWSLFSFIATALVRCFVSQHCLGDDVLMAVRILVSNILALINTSSPMSCWFSPSLLLLPLLQCCTLLLLLLSYHLIGPDGVQESSIVVASQMLCFMVCLLIATACGSNLQPGASCDAVADIGCCFAMLIC